MAEPVYVAGVGMTRFGVHAGRTVTGLTREAVTEALGDAGLELGDIDCAFFGNTTQGALEGQLMIGGQVALREIGLQRIPVVNVENACATGSTALHLAISQVRAGSSDVALAVGAEKMNVGDRDRTMRVFDGAYDVAHPERLEQLLAELGGEVDTSGAGQRSIFMDIYAAWARAHMKAFGTTAEQIAAVSSKNHGHAVHNERAHYRSEMSVAEILAARPLAYPLTVPMCAPVTDGAAAVIVCSASALRRLAPRSPVKVLASVVGTGSDRPLDDYERHITRQAGLRAYEQAGISPDDVSVAEVHDATAFAEILLSEMLGLCPPGAGGQAAEAGETTIGGRIPINPSGGLESKGHPLGATGLGQVHELVLQLRGEAAVRQVDGARIAIAENGGGFYGGEEAVAVITMLGA